MESGKLKNSWVPPRPIRELRDLTRHRVRGNIKVTSAAGDLFGVSGRKNAEALVEANGAGLDGGLRAGAAAQQAREFELALEGTFTGEQRWL